MRKKRKESEENKGRNREDGISVGGKRRKGGRDDEAGNEEEMKLKDEEEMEV